MNFMIKMASNFLTLCLILICIVRGYGRSDFTPCSDNPTEAYLDVFVMIDTSAHMGSAGITKIQNTLNFVFSSGFPIGQNYDIRTGSKNTRVSIITYDENATIVANFSQINSFTDISKSLSGIHPTSSQISNIHDAMAKAFYTKTNCTDPLNCSLCFYYRRPSAFLLFAASANSPDEKDLHLIDYYSKIFDDGTLIAINFNEQDPALELLLKNLTWNGFYQTPMYNFKGSSKSLVKDLTWALTQANCYCGDMEPEPWLIHNFYWDAPNNRYARSRECFYFGIAYNETESLFDVCSSILDKIPAIPAVIASEQTTKTLEKWQNYNWWTDIPAYIGLHLGKQGRWVWYDYDRSEYPVGNYTAWGPGQPNITNIQNTCAIANYVNGYFAWSTYGCHIDLKGVYNTICQGLACDTTSLSCCQECNGGEVETCDSSSKNPSIGARYPACFYYIIGGKKKVLQLIDAGLYRRGTHLVY